MSEPPDPDTQDPNTQGLQPAAEAGVQTGRTQSPVPAESVAPEIGPPEIVSPEIEAYLKVWCETLSAVLGQIAGQGQDLALRPMPEAEPGAAANATPGPAEVFFNVTLAGMLRGEQTLGLTAAQGRWLGAAFMGELPPEASSELPLETPPEAPPVLTSEQRETLEELFRQVAGRAASDLKRSWGEVQIHVQSSGAPSWPAAATAWFTSPAGATPPVALELRLSAALVATLRRPEAAAAVAGPQPGAGPAASSGSSRSGAAVASASAFSPGNEASSTAGPTRSSTPSRAPNPTMGAAPAEAAAPAAVNLDLLKNVPLNLTLRFGQRRMALREILELGPGSVIELDRRLKEPVDLLLDGKVLARGEVVVVHGCYGLRVTQIAARGGEEQ
jgi:flagellar motor switch protein FliN